MFRQIVQRVSNIVSDLRQHFQHFKKSPPQFNSRTPTKRPKPQAGKKR